MIAYGSRALTTAERNYHLHSSKLEFLALKLAITEQVRYYLHCAHNPLTYVLSTAKLNATGHHWLADPADFPFTIKYRPGKANQDADSLSRIHIEQYIEMCKGRIRVYPCCSGSFYKIAQATTNKSG